MLHGLGEHSGRYRELVEKLNARGIETVRFDFRGCGASEGKRQWIERFEDYVDDVETVCEEIVAKLDPLPLFLFGHSLGGALAIWFGARRQELFKGILLSAPAFQVGGGVSAFKIAVGKKLERFFPAMKMPGTLDLAALSRDPKVAVAYQADPLNCTFNTLRQGTQIIAALDEVPSKAEKIRAPLLIVHGDADAICKVEGSQTLLPRFASSDKTLRIFGGSCHEIHNDLDKEKEIEVLSDWIQARA